MAQDISVEGGKYTITFKDAVSEDDDEITGDKANIMNMALARGCWFQWEYTVQIELHTGDVEDDLIELREMQALYAEVSEWTPQMLESPANLTEEFSQLLRWGVGTEFTDQASSATVDGVAGGFIWPPVIELPGGGGAIPSWSEVQADPARYSGGAGRLMKSADGVIFRYQAGTGVVRVEPENINLVSFTGPVVASDADIAKVRRELEAAIESKTQRNQEKQAQLQDLTAALQRWFTFTTNVNERKKRDADTIAGNFH
jgi:hypothetical protein